MLQTIPQDTSGDYLLQKKIEVMLDLQYKKIKADMDTLKSAVDGLAQEMQGLRSALRKEAYAAEAHTPQPQFQQQPIPQMQAPQIQQPMQPQFQQMQQPVQQAPQMQQPMQAQPQQAGGSVSRTQQQFQQNLTSDDVSIEKFFSYGKKR